MSTTGICLSHYWKDNKVIHLPLILACCSFSVYTPFSYHILLHNFLFISTVICNIIQMIQKFLELTSLTRVTRGFFEILYLPQLSLFIAEGFWGEGLFFFRGRHLGHFQSFVIIKKLLFTQIQKILYEYAFYYTVIKPVSVITAFYIKFLSHFGRNYETVCKTHVPFYSLLVFAWICFFKNRPMILQMYV